MRFTPARISHIARSVIERLQARDLLAVHGSAETLQANLEKVITDELSVEDRLNAEVRELLKQYETEFERGRADYQKMFSMVKNKLVRERGIVL